MARTLKKRDINLLLAMNRKKRAPTLSGGRGILLLFLVLVVAALAGGSVLYYSEISRLEDSKNQYTIYLEDPQTIAAYEESQNAQVQAAQMRTQADELMAIIDGLATYPNLTGGDYAQLYESAGKRVAISNVNFDKTSGILSFQGSATTVTGVPIFVTQLRMSGIFEDVSYGGYVESIVTKELPPTIDPATGDVINRHEEITNYVFSVTCLVKAPNIVPGEIGKRAAAAEEIIAEEGETSA